MNNQFVHAHLVDSAGKGDGGTVFGGSRLAQWRNAAPGGNGIVFETPNGASQLVQNVFMSGAIADAPGYAIVYRGSAGIGLKNVAAWGLPGFLCDATSQPSVAGDALVQMTDCQFDSNNFPTANMLINLGVGVTRRVFITMNGQWVAGSDVDGIKIMGNTTPLRISLSSGIFFANGGWGINGVSNINLGQALLGATPTDLPVFDSNVDGPTTG